MPPPEKRDLKLPSCYLLSPESGDLFLYRSGDDGVVTYPAALVAEPPLAELTNEAPAPVEEVPVETVAPKPAVPDAGVEAFEDVADGLGSPT